MLNLKTFALFESNNYNYTLDQVKGLPIFSILKSLGFEDSTTDRIWNNGNMRLYNAELDMNDPAECITIYGNGPVRKTVRKWMNSAEGSPHILRRFPPITSLEDWNIRFFYVLEWAKKRYKSRKGRVIDYAPGGDETNFAKVIVDVYKSDFESFNKVYQRLSDREKEIFLEAIGQSREEFEKNLDKYLDVRRRAFL